MKDMKKKILRAVCLGLWLSGSVMLCSLVIFGIAVYLMPVLFAWVAGGVGVGYDSRPLDILLLIGFPGLFVTGLLVVGTCTGIRSWFRWSYRKVSVIINK